MRALRSLCDRSGEAVPCLVAADLWIARGAPRLFDPSPHRRHMKTLITTSVLAVFLVIASCSKSGDKDKATTKEPAKTEAAKTEGAGHASKDVVPGSHEDWCAEHAVPESQCTQCDPSLAAAFKATGDWCVEHGLPESQCLKCNPDVKIVRPPKK
jgi:hypothetical protein